MISARSECAAVPVDARHVLIIGGWDSSITSTVSATTELLDLATMEFVPGPTMQTARGGPAAVLLDAARILVIGGHDVDDDFATTELLATEATSVEARHELEPHDAAHHSEAAAGSETELA
jgi:hypothetical protein